MTLIMGVLNATPDSFSDGGMFCDPQVAIERGVELVAQGAHIVDVGGESTRPGATRPSLDEELSRVVPVIEGLHALGITTSVDTMRAAVASASLAVGADMVNDVSGGLADDQMATVVAAAGVPFIAMHWRGHSDAMNAMTHYDDVATEVVAHLDARVHALTAAGVAPAQIILDPGFGFAKEAAHNWTLMAHLSDLMSLGHRLLIGTSRKRFLGSLPGVPGAIAADQRDAATAATSLLAAQAGAWAVRVHDVPSTAQALGVLEMVRRG